MAVDGTTAALDRMTFGMAAGDKAATRDTEETVVTVVTSDTVATVVMVTLAMATVAMATRRTMAVTCSRGRHGAGRVGTSGDSEGPAHLTIGTTRKAKICPSSYREFRETSYSEKTNYCLRLVYTILSYMTKSLKWCTRNCTW